MRRRFKLQMEPGEAPAELWGLWCSGCRDWVYTTWGKDEPALWDSIQEARASRRTVLAVCEHTDRIQFFNPSLYE